ncbi:MAG: GTP 3',8-cyclase MoaA [Firmicutes bacterium HGW-Firmicutes-7]|nr:MAG: GTP 3',8-cyclase MoaA [Firmicutes bacterium HGW-Firmicutes-7]
MKDSYGREVNYLRLSITDRCNLRCKYCMPEGGIEKLEHDAILSLEEIDEIVGEFVELGINKVRLTGGEPLVRNGIISLIEKISRHSGITDLALTTNGIHLKAMAKDLKNAGLTRINVSLDSLNDKKYATMTRGGKLQDVLEGIEMAKKVGLTPIKLNVVLIGGFNDDEVENFVALTKDESIDVRFIELMPIGEVASWSLHNFLSNDYVLKKVPSLRKITASEPASPAAYYQLPGGKGRVGLISPISCKFCDTCNRIRLTSEGQLKYCLHSNEEFDLRTVLRNKGSLREIIEHSISQKPLEHSIEEGNFVSKNMVQVGG